MMKIIVLVGLVALSLGFIGNSTVQNANSSGSGNANVPNAENSSKRGPVFRATADQIKQAQAILKERGFYSGEQSGKLDVDTRAGLKKYQVAEGLRETGTLNKTTLEKMGIALTDAQKGM